MHSMCAAANAAMCHKTLLSEQELGSWLHPKVSRWAARVSNLICHTLTCPTAQCRDCVHRPSCSITPPTCLRTLIAPRHSSRHDYSHMGRTDASSPCYASTLLATATSHTTGRGLGDSTLSTSWSWETAPFCRLRHPNISSSHPLVRKSLGRFFLACTFRIPSWCNVASTSNRIRMVSMITPFGDALFYRF